MTTDGLSGEPDARADEDAIEEGIVAQRPSVEPTEDAAAPSPFYVREWHGGPLFMCPAGDYPGRSHEAVVRHIVAAHPRHSEPDIDTRARQAGIILAHR